MHRISVLIIASIAVLLIACINPAAAVPISSITISSLNDRASIEDFGGTLQLSAQVLPLNADIDSISWSIDEGSDFALVTSTGMVHAIANGTVVVKAEANDDSGVSAIFNLIITGQQSTVTLPATSILPISESAPIYCQASTSPAFETIAAEVRVLQAGNAVLNLNAGEYYFRSFHDLNNDGSLSAGDLFQATYHLNMNFIPNSNFYSYIARSYMLHGGNLLIGIHEMYRMESEGIVFPAQAGTIVASLNYIGSLGEVSAAKIMQYTGFNENLSIQFGGYNDRNGAKLVIIGPESGNYMLGGIFDANGNGQDEEDPASWHAGKPMGIGVFDGTPIPIIAGQVTYIEYELTDEFMSPAM